MIKSLMTSALAGVLAVGLATAAFAVTGEFDNMCAQGLATGQQIKTDCSINGQVEGRTYCFGSAEAKAEFMKNPTANLAKAQATYQSLKKPG
jgi:YHS domain-containing protein